MLRLDIDAVNRDRVSFLQIQDRDQQTLWLRRHYNDESSITKFSFRWAHQYQSFMQKMFLNSSSGFAF